MVDEWIQEREDRRGGARRERGQRERVERERGESERIGREKSKVGERGYKERERG